MKYYNIVFPNGKAKALTFSYDDGVETDIRLMEIFKKNGLKGTFNLNGALMNGNKTVYSRRLTEEECQTAYADPDFEVACHAYTHPRLERCDEAVCLDEIISDRLKLESLFGTQIHGMAYPFGTYNDTVLDCCRTAGIYYNRTVNSTSSFSLPTDWLTWHPTCHHVNEKIFELADTFLNKPITASLPPRLFYIWGHSYEFNMRNDWERMEQLCEILGGHDDVWYATNMEIFMYCRAFNRLKYSVDGSVITNPTDTEIWVRKGASSEIFSIKPGETVKVEE